MKELIKVGRNQYREVDIVVNDRGELIIRGIGSVNFDMKEEKLFFDAMYFESGDVDCNKSKENKGEEDDKCHLIIRRGIVRGYSHARIKVLGWKNIKSYEELPKGYVDCTLYEEDEMLPLFFEGNNHNGESVIQVYRNINSMDTMEYTIGVGDTFSPERFDTILRIMYDAAERLRDASDIEIISI